MLKQKYVLSNIIKFFDFEKKEDVKFLVNLRRVSRAFNGAVLVGITNV